MTSPRPKLTFKMRLPDTAETKLISGMLYLQFKNQKQQEFKCTSGLAGKQFRGAQILKGLGPLPSSEMIYPMEYMVVTNAHTMNVTGHKGTPMYPIIPNLIKVGGSVRGAFGIHEDLNAPGTIGCIALPEAFQWVLFKNAIEKIADAGLRFIPLSVIYH